MSLFFLKNFPKSFVTAGFSKIEQGGGGYQKTPTFFTLGKFSILNYYFFPKSLVTLEFSKNEQGRGGYQKTPTFYLWKNFKKKRNAGILY